MRYTLGHTLVTLLTVQSVSIKDDIHRNGDEDVDLNARSLPLSRQVVSYLRKIYVKQGLRVFAKGIYIAGIYQLLKTAITSILTATVLRPAWTYQFADFLVTILLAEVHMQWTHATLLSGKLNWRYRFWTVNRSTWRRLILPCAAQGGAVLLLNWTSDYIPDTSSNVAQTLSAIAVLRVAIALAVRSFVLAPATAWLTLAEASCLYSGQQTLVYNQGKGRFLSSGDILKTSSNEPWRGVTWHSCFWLLELHLKKCVVHILLEGFMAATVHSLA